MGKKNFETLYEAVTKNIDGFYTLKSVYQKNMEKFYESEYFQEERASYSKTKYEPIDIEYQKNCFAQKLMIWNRIHSGDTVWGEVKKQFLDIGCGEGHALSYFYDMGWDVTGIDLSSYGMELHNPDMKQYLIQGDSEKVVKALAAQGKMFDIINGDNMLEHVSNPQNLLQEIRKLCKKETLLCIKVPNDFSLIQKLAYEMGEIDGAFWVTKETCEHINYFSVDSLTRLGENLGFERVAATADWPIDFFLLNPTSNYQKKKERGHDCHIACAMLENALNRESADRALALQEALAACGIGRDINVYFRISN